jgi:hypothetical protein
MSFLARIGAVHTSVLYRSHRSNDEGGAPDLVFAGIRLPRLLEKEQQFRTWLDFERFLEGLSDEQLEEIAIFWRFRRSVYGHSRG